MGNRDVLDLDGWRLRLFIVLFDTGSLADAAKALSMDEAGVSDGLISLRKAFGDPLFNRQGGRLEPTTGAAELAPQVRQILAGLDSLAVASHYDPAAEDGAITIAANVTEMLEEVVEIRSEIVREAPNARVRFLELGARANIEPFLDGGVADLVITVRAPSYARTLRTIGFGRDRHVLFYDPAVRGPIRSIDDYASAEHATLDFGRGGKSTIDEALEEHAVSRRVTLSAPDVHALGALMRGTAHIATMQARLARSTFAHLAHCQPPLYLPPQVFDMVWHRRDETSPRSLWLRGLVTRGAEERRFGRE